MNRRRIAFVYWPGLAPDSARLETMPFAINAIKRLAAANWEVDVFLWERALVDYREIFSTTVRVRYQIAPKRMLYRMRPIRLARLTATFMTRTYYQCAFGLGQIGSYLGAVISLASRCPLVMLNDEFPSYLGPSRWAPLERWAAKQASVIIVPSADRIEHLTEELGLSNQEKTFVEFRNAPKVSHPLERRDWHALLGIPSGKRIFLNAGTLSDATQVPEILSSVAYWPEDTVLLLHSRAPELEDDYRRQMMTHLDAPGRVFWTPTVLSDKLLNSLVGHCCGCLALYRNVGPNFLLIGTSSGKLMRSVMCGSPVIASNLESLRFVSQQGIGVQVSHPSEIPAAIQELTRNEQVYRERCLFFAKHELTREQRSWEDLVRALSNKIDLRKGLPQQEATEFMGVRFGGEKRAL
jgi:glycosyltransferase involved in cell wall biosynthesis